MGTMWLGEDALDYTSEKWEDSVSTVVHEIMHALGFDESLLEDFAAYDAANYVYETIDGVDRLLVKTPKVLEKAAAHFGCDDITHIELEN